MIILILNNNNQAIMSTIYSSIRFFSPIDYVIVKQLLANDSKA